MRLVSFLPNRWFTFQFALVAFVTLLVAVSPVMAQVIICPPDATVSNDAELCSAVVNFPAPTVSGTNAGDVVICDPPSGSTFPVGTNEVICAIMQATNNLASCTFNIAVDDTEPPVIADVGVSRTFLWPPNHKMVKVTVNYRNHDNCDPAPTCTLTVASSEAMDGRGDGSTSPDWQVIDSHHVMLRAERSGQGNSRTYTITITCVDQSGNSSSTDVKVRVPHSRGRGVGQGNSTVDQGNTKSNGHGK
jgi:hypothetical protein